MDLLAVSGIPIICAALLASWLFSLHGGEWIAVYGCALLTAISGAVCLFRAKLPLYRQRRFFTFGSRHLPQASRRIYSIGKRLSIAGISVAVVLLLQAVMTRQLARGFERAFRPPQQLPSPISSSPIGTP